MLIVHCCPSYCISGKLRLWFARLLLYESHTRPDQMIPSIPVPHCGSVLAASPEHF